MQFWSWLTELYLSEERLFTVFVAAAGLIALAAVAGYFLKNTGAFAALSAVIGGVARVLIGGVAAERAAFAVAAFLLVYRGVLYLLLFAFLVVRRSILERKRRRAEIARRLCYTLPDRENTYIRSRLCTALQLPKEALNADMGALDALEEPVKLEHARLLLSKVKEASLSQAERLQTEEMGKALSLYLLKDAWSIEDLRAVNELCASLLKLSAKYAV